MDGTPVGWVKVKHVLSLKGVVTLVSRSHSCVCGSPQGSLVFVVGKTEGLLLVSGRRHNADDLVATALAVEPIKTVYGGR